jgi:hypothetical protein
VAGRAHATVTKINASHLSLISHPGDVTSVIEEAARHLLLSTAPPVVALSLLIALFRDYDCMKKARPS